MALFLTIVTVIISLGLSYYFGNKLMNTFDEGFGEQFAATLIGFLMLGLFIGMCVGVFELYTFILNTLG